MKRFCLSLLLTLSAGLAQAQGLDIESRYTFEDLDRFWRKVLNQDAAAAANSYASVYQAMNAVPDESKNRQEGIWEPSSGSGQPITFFIEAIPSGSAALIAKREMGLHMYMIRQEKYQAPEIKNPLEMLQNQKRLQEEKVSLALRRKQTGLELFLIKMLRYREADSLEAKCSYLREAQTFYSYAQGVLISDRNRLLDIKGLSDLNESTYAANINALRDQKVCQTRRVASRVEALARTEQVLNGKIVASLEREYAQSIDPIAQVLSRDFDTVLSDVYKIDPFTGDLLEFESLESNAKANIEMVDKDDLGVEALFPQLDRINFDAIRKTAATSFVPAAIEAVLQEQQNLVNATRTFLGNLKKVYDTVPENQRANFSDCNGLDALFDSVLPKNVATKEFAGKTYPPFGDTGTLIRQMTNCLTITQTYLKGLQTRDTKTQMVDEFAARLEALSREMLRMAN